MISIGGADTAAADRVGYDRADDWSHGLGILDLTAMRWSNVYNAYAPAYDSPEIVKEWYNAGSAFVSYPCCICLLK